jgi:hypothetical protein
MSRKNLRAITWILAVVTILSLVADFFSDTLVKFMVNSAGLEVGPSLAHWLGLLPIILTVIVILVSILHNTEAAKETLEEVDRHKQMLTEIASHVKETHQLVRQKAEIRAINPHNLSEFQEVFGGAGSICAYNPPLSLLIKEKPGFRNVIFEVLRQDQGSYHAIVGPEGSAKLLDLHNIWINENKERNTTDVISKMRVTAYMYAERLHSELRAWPGFNSSDLRGLSFFLVETASCRKVLLFILGKPFVETFDVPDIGLLITEPTDEAEIHDRLMEVFNNRWGTLSTRDEDASVIADKSLPDFYSRHSRGKSDFNKTVKV